MALEKQSLNNFLPDGFETEDKDGYKTNFSDDKISTGFQKDVADILSGPNLNNLIDVIGKNTNTLNNYVEYLNSLSINKTPIIDSNNQLNSTQIGLKVYSATETYLLNDLVTTIQDGKVLFYKSLVASNTGNPLTNTDYWEEVKLGGGSGLEVGDIGIALYVDETKGLRRYLNGQIVDRNKNTEAFFTRLQEITTLHPSLLCTEEEWQTAKTMSAFGQVGKFVFNYSGEDIISVRLPRVVNVQGVFDLQNLGMTVKESLPNITGNLGGGKNNDIGFSTSAVDGAFYTTSETKSRSFASDANTQYGLGFDASRVSSTYQDGAPVQQEAIQYPYFIQIATGSETENNIINEIELNNPYSLFDSKYSDHELNNLSWLKSEGQWNSKAVYPSAYDKLLKVYNGTETVEGLSVKLSTETYTDYDFVLNTAEETFRLPLKTLHSDDTVDSLSLYFYVGETVQNANLIDVGRIGEQLANKVDTSNTQWATNACMPDYSAGVNKGLTFTSDSYYRMYVWGRQGTQISGALGITIKINDITFKDLAFNYGAAGYVIFDIKPSDEVNITHSATSCEVICYPFIGVNI